jgi:transposase-like protein
MTSTFKIAGKYNTQEKCIDYLKNIRWGNGNAICPFCGSNNTAELKNDYGRYHCNACKTHFSVTVGTIFHDTRLDLPKWFMLIGMMVNSKSGISSKELERNVGITYKTAWLCGLRVRCAMIESEKALQSVVEMDEAYVGGRPKKKNKKGEVTEIGEIPAENTPSITAESVEQNPVKRGRGTGKTPIVGIVERKGQIVLKVSQRLRGDDLLRMLKENVRINTKTKVITDGYKGYLRFDEIVKHLSVNHSKGEFAKGKGNYIHTNTIEGFFSILKRSIKGNYIAISKKYLPMYLTQSQFTYNHRDETADLFDYFMHNAMNTDKCMFHTKPIEKPSKMAYMPRVGKKKTACKKCELPKKKPIIKTKKYVSKKRTAKGKSKKGSHLSR